MRILIMMLCKKTLFFIIFFTSIGASFVKSMDIQNNHNNELVTYEDTKQENPKEIPTKPLKKKRKVSSQQNNQSEKSNLLKEEYCFACVLCAYTDSGPDNETLIQKYTDHLMNLHESKKINIAGIASSVKKIQSI